MKMISPLAINSGNLTSSTIAANEYIDSNGAIQTAPTWAAGTTYADGAIVIYENRVYESLTASNTGNQPDLTDSGSSPAWLDLGATNRYRAFDGIISRGSLSTATDITVEITPSTIINGIAIFNLTGSTVDITMTDPTDGVVYTKSFGLVSTENVIDGFTYFFEPILKQQNVSTTDLAPYPNATTKVTVSNTGDRRIGEVVIGKVVELGSTEVNASVGIQDYSVKQRDAFGNFTILERAFSKRGDFTLFLNNGIFGNVARVLTERRAKPTVFIPVEDNSLSSPLLLYGFPKDFILEAAYPDYSLCTLEIEGLT